MGLANYTRYLFEDREPAFGRLATYDATSGRIIRHVPVPDNAGLFASWAMDCDYNTPISTPIRTLLTPQPEKSEDIDNTSAQTEGIGENMDFSGMFNGMFGHLGQGMCRLGINGDVAVKTANGYKTYNVKTGRLTNVTQFCFDIGQEFFFVMPTTKARKGDILLVDGHPKCVIENNDNKTIKVMDYENSAIQEIVPERHVFMGQTYFYRKIVSMFGSGNFLKGSKGMNKMFKLMMMKEVFGGMLGGKNGGTAADGFGAMIPMMMMGNMFGGGKDSEFGDFSEMFDLDFDSEDEDADADTADEAADDNA